TRADSDHPFEPGGGRRREHEHTNGARVLQPAIAPCDGLLGGPDRLGDEAEWSPAIDHQRMKQLVVDSIELGGIKRASHHVWRILAIRRTFVALLAATADSRD